MPQSGLLPRWVAVALLLVAVAAPVAPAAAGVIGGQVKSLLAKASDRALDKLAVPGTFIADETVKIVMPGGAQQTSELAKLADQAGLTNALVQSMNTAAELVATEAKPIFRSAIDRMTIKGSIDIVGHDEAATRYLRKAAGRELHARLRPLVMVALDRSGAFSEMDKIARTLSLTTATGLSRDGLTDSVTDQALDGMFKYIANEEQALREDPIGAVFKGL